MSKKIIFLILIVIALLVIFLMYRGSMFSKEILRLEILGPDIVKVGDEIQYTVQYKNNGNFVLEKAKLVFVLPVSTYRKSGS